MKLNSNKSNDEEWNGKNIKLLKMIIKKYKSTEASLPNI